MWLFKKSKSHPFAVNPDNIVISQRWSERVFGNRAVAGEVDHVLGGDLKKTRWMRCLGGVLLLSSLCSRALADMTSVTVQLKWQHQFQFAGYYAAIDQGYYQEAGLDVQLLAAQEATDSIQTVLSGDADFGVGTSELMLHSNQGDSILVLAAIMQHSPLALVALKDAGVQNIHQLAEQPMMIEPSSAELLAYFKKEGVEVASLNTHVHTHQLEDLLDGTVQAMSVYTTDEPYRLDQKGIDYQVFHPLSSGIDFYNDILFTTEAYAQAHPKVVQSFRQASLQGWQYAMQHPEEIVDLILDHYSQRKSRENLLYEARHMQELMKPELVEIGYINPARWQLMAQTYHQLDLLPDAFDATQMLYVLSEEKALQALKQRLTTMAWVSLLVLVIALLIYRQYHQANVRRKQFESLFLNAPVSLMEIDAKGMICNWNKWAEKTFQYSAKEMMGNNVFQYLVEPDKREQMAALTARARNENQITRSENFNVRKDGHKLLCQWANMPMETNARHRRHVICMARDITEQKATEDELYHAANFDELTGLPNRNLILTQLKQSLAQAKKNQTLVALLFIDLNGFKSINDQYGHLVGDEVLRQSGARIKQAVRDCDQVGRLSGDEFLVVVRQLPGEEALQRLVAHIMSQVQRPIDIEGHSLQMSASVGTSLYPKEAKEVQKLIRIADQTMYKVKVAHHQGPLS